MKKFFILAALLFLPTMLGAEVVDGAGLFSPGAVSQANAKIQAMQASSGKQLYIETVTSLDGANVDQAASQKLRERGIKGVVILIAKTERKISVRVHEDTRDVFGRPQEQAARAAFKGGGDAALARLVDTCVASLSRAGGTSEPGRQVKKEDSSPADITAEKKSWFSGILSNGWVVAAIIIGGIGLLIFAGIYIVYRILKGLFKAVFGMFSPPAQQQPTTYQQGQPQTGGTYSPGGYAPQPSRGGGFVSTLLTGMLGAAAGSFIYDRVFGGGGSVFGAGSHDSGSSSSYDSSSSSDTGSSSSWDDSSSSSDSGSSSSWDSSDTSSSSGGDSGSSSDW